MSKRNVCQGENAFTGPSGDTGRREADKRATPPCALTLEAFAGVRFGAVRAMRTGALGYLSGGFTGTVLKNFFATLCLPSSSHPTILSVL